MLTTKDTILSGINDAIQQVAALNSSVADEAALSHPILDKWSVAEQTVHLIVATRAVGKALAAPKIMLMGFGSAKEPSRNYDEMAEFYTSKLADVPAVTGFEPELRGKSWEEIQEKWASSAELFEKGLKKWSEKDMDKRLLPHPLMGKITVREMLYFTHFHIHHHRKQIVRLIEEL